MTLDNLRLLTETLIPLVGNVGDLISKIEKGLVNTTATAELKNILAIALDRAVRAEQGDSERDARNDARLVEENKQLSIDKVLTTAQHTTEEPTKP